MVETQTLILFAGTCLVLALMPGPDNLFVAAQALAQGRRAALGAASGILLGGLLWTLAATFGLTAALAALPRLLVAIQLAGASYLCFLAWKLWPGQRGQAVRQGSQPVREHAFGKGLLTNLLNPKVGLYYLAFLPQFLVLDGPQIWGQMVMLGLIFNIVGGIVMYGIALTASIAHGQMSSSSLFAKWAARLAAFILLAIAGNLLFHMFTSVV